jgi:hypothetical protein
MKKLQQIREENELLKEREEIEDRKIATLIRAGLFDAKKIPMLKRAMDKDNTKITPTERKALLELLDSLMDQVLKNKGIYQKVRSALANRDELQEATVKEKNPIVPTVLVLQRKSVRQFPDGIVGLYYARRIDKYVSIPFFEPANPLAILPENSIIDNLKIISEQEAEHSLTLMDGNKYTVTPTDANKIVSVYEAMNKDNKKKMEKMLNESVDSFNKVKKFAVRQ